MTLRLSSACSNQLSYRPEIDMEARGLPACGGLSERDFVVNRSLPVTVEARGFEPLTSSLQSWRSTN